MAKLNAVIASLCILSFLGVAYCQENLKVSGLVYCDACRALFETTASEPIFNAKVRLECRDRANAANVTLSLDATTDSTGYYTFEVEGRHEEEICEVVLVQSSRADCKEIIPALDRARIALTNNNGIISTSRFVNALGFIKTEPVLGCVEILKSYGLLPTAHI